MTDLPIIRRMLDEHRKAVIPLLAGLVVNILAYAFIVYPLSRQVADVAGRDARASKTLAAAKQDYAQAAGTLTGKDRATTELATFYKSVLPEDVTGARRLSFLRLYQLARESGLKVERSSAEVVSERTKSTLNRFKTKMELTGSYAAMRTFVHQLEIAPEFVVIDNVELAEDDTGSELKVTVELSTYFRMLPS